ncbi:putative alpha amylase [Phaeomoniella chlamydospora]|uniref:Putative alpha amylase n=1 Tax=Phaeomoniella chlamydospora TaxID=158046 RepID=A0A0G2GZX2_PHACM|nr:putative alpha amylase [Phaeomoniella chlamydospora]
MSVTSRVWWKDGVVYQIYPSSFKDSNGDGLGDVPGITSKLDYLKDLGVDIIWVSPMYDSPQVDMGYDISNYEEVYPPFGTVADMEDLIEKAHGRGMRIILDLVINHTSDQHAWFKESRLSKDNPKRDWYIWRPTRYGENGSRQPPNNWRSFFSEPAWEWDEHTQEYYLHCFATQQPDLNWENEDARNAIYDSAIRFWLNKGVDGFRVDTVNMYSKGSELPDVPILDPKSFYQPAYSAICNGPRMHEFLREMNTKVFNQYDTMTVGELPWTPDPAHVLRYVGSGDKQINMCFQFDLCDLGVGRDHKFNMQPWSVSSIKQILSKWQTFHLNTDGWTTAFLENHDNGRSISRYADDSTPLTRTLSAKMLCILLTTLTGTLFIYQGQEIGMVNAPPSWPISEYKDIESTNYYNLIGKQTNSSPSALESAMSSIRILARDHARLPMQWTPGPHAGFIDGPPTNPSSCSSFSSPSSPPSCTSNPTVTPWMRTHPLAQSGLNVETQSQSPYSVLNFYKRMLQLRKRKIDLFGHGIFKIFGNIHDPEDRTMIFEKSLERHEEEGNQKAIVALNFEGTGKEFEFPNDEKNEKEDWEWEWELVGCSYEGDEEGQGGGFREGWLRGWEGRVYLGKKMLW